MTIKNSQTKRYWNLWGWLNVYSSSTDIDDNQWVGVSNYTTRGNMVVNLPWFSRAFTFWTWAKKVVWLKESGDYVYAIYDKVLYAQSKSWWVPKTFNLTKFTNDWSGSTRTFYNIFVGKVVDRFIVITDNDGVDDLYILYFDWTTFTDKTWSTTWLTDKNFTCAGFYRSHLILWGLPKAPSTIAYSWVASGINPEYLLYFSTVPWSSPLVTVGNQQVIGDESPVVAFIERQDVYYIIKKNSIWKISDVKFLESQTYETFIVIPETSNGANSQSCILNVIQDVVYFDWKSVRRLSYEQNNLALKDVSISDNKIDNLIDSLPDNQKQAQSLFVYPYYKLFLRTNLSDENDVAFVYNIVDKSWSIEEVIRVTVATSWEKGSAYFGSISGWQVYKDSDSYTFDWGAIKGSWRSKSYSWWDEVDYKRIYEVEVYGKITPNFPLYIDIYNWDTIIRTDTVEYSSWIEPTTWTATLWDSLIWGFWANLPWMQDFKKRLDIYDDGREFSVWVRTNGIGKFEIHWINFIFKFINPYEIY